MTRIYHRKFRWHGKSTPPPPSYWVTRRFAFASAAFDQSRKTIFTKKKVKCLNDKMLFFILVSTRILQQYFHSPNKWTRLLVWHWRTNLSFRCSFFFANFFFGPISFLLDFPILHVSPSGVSKLYDICHRWFACLHDLPRIVLVAVRCFVHSSFVYLCDFWQEHKHQDTVKFCRLTLIALFKVRKCLYFASMAFLFYLFRWRQTKKNHFQSCCSVLCSYCECLAAIIAEMSA